MRIKKKLMVVVLAAALSCTCMPVQGIGVADVFAESKTANDFIINENGVL